MLSNKLFNVGCIFYQPPWILQNLYTNIPMIKLLHVYMSFTETAKSLVPEPTLSKQVNYSKVFQHLACLVDICVILFYNAQKINN